MRVIFTKLAKQEMQDAVAFYEMELRGLGRRLREEIKKAILRIVEYPNAWSIERDEVRKCLLHTFPYKILYSVEEEYILIIAIAHQHRKPDYWVEE